MKVFIGVGSNDEHKQWHVDCAMKFLSALLDEFRSSSYYTTPAINGLDADYLNAVVHGCTPLSAEELVMELKRYEQRSGRVKGHAQGAPVIIDLDLVIADQQVLRPNDMSRDYFLRGYEELLDGNCQAPS